MCHCEYSHLFFWLIVQAGIHFHLLAGARLQGLAHPKALSFRVALVPWAPTSKQWQNWCQASLWCHCFPLVLCCHQTDRSAGRCCWRPFCRPLWSLGEDRGVTISKTALAGLISQAQLSPKSVDSMLVLGISRSPPKRVGSMLALGTSRLKPPLSAALGFSHQQRLSLRACLVDANLVLQYLFWPVPILSHSHSCSSNLSFCLTVEFHLCQDGLPCCEGSRAGCPDVADPHPLSTKAVTQGLCVSRCRPALPRTHTVDG